MQILAYLLARFSEPSSYAGLGALLALLGWNLPDGALADLVQLCAAASALAALFLKERGLIRAIVLVFAVVPLLSACAGLAAAGSMIGTACAEYGRARDAAEAVRAAGLVPAGIAADIGAIESFGDAACASPPAGDPLETAIWFGRLAGQLATLATPRP